MLAFIFELLAGRYSATSYNSRSRAEWPPHPARFFSAAVATWADTDEDEDRSGRERRALEWLEALNAPEIFAADAFHRTVVTSFVPVNDENVVPPVARQKLDDAVAELSNATAAKDCAKLEKSIAKLEAKLLADTQKSIAAPTKARKNDADALKVLPEHRTKQPRTFPSVTPQIPTFGFVWPDAEPPADIFASLGDLASRLVRLGHSSSLVHCVATTTPAVKDQQLAGLDKWVEDTTFGTEIIRWVSAGQLNRLESLHQRHQGNEPRVLPATAVRYRRGGGAIQPLRQQSVFSEDMVILARRRGPRLPVISVAGVAKQLRRALMGCAEEPVAEIISGHKPDGSPSECPHLAVAPLPNVFGPKPDGAILGIGLIIPRECSTADRRAIATAIKGLEMQGTPATTPGDSPVTQLKLGDSGRLELQRTLPGEERLFTLRAETWSRPSRYWLSATPVALDRHPGDLLAKNEKKRREAFEAAEETIRKSLKSCGIDASKATIAVTRSCVMQGTAKPRAYPRFPIDEDRQQRVLVHVRIVFEEPVCGPLLIGAGRYQGLGLLAPVRNRTEGHGRV